ncbi:MAG: helix-turn-helix transcriptional regulator [Chloroflexi bacterium]|nr:helix-turn-helix transcriptional regulator [Chloroflexota bacterium]
MRDKLLARDFGAVIRRLRYAAGMSQEKFALLCGVHRTYMGQIERGEKTVTIETASRLAHALGLSLSELFANLERDKQEKDAYNRV